VPKTTPKRILVTGADGFIGSHLVEALTRAGHVTRCFVMYNSFNSWGWLDHAEGSLKSRLDVVSGDIRDERFVRLAMQGCDAVVHLAALVSIPYSYLAPAHFVDTNVRGTLNLLEAAREVGVARFIHTSTSEVYGSGRQFPMNEEHPIRGQSPYSATKIAADQLAIAYHASFGLPVVVVRPFNTYGPRQSARAIIPTIITQIERGEREIKLGSLTPTRDFTYIADTASGFISALQSDRGAGEIVNLGTNFEISVGDLVKEIADLMQVRVTPCEEERRKRPSGSEVQRLRADNSKAKVLFGWEPGFSGLSGLRDGLRLTIDWFRTHGHSAGYKPERYNI